MGLITSLKASPEFQKGLDFGARQAQVVRRTELPLAFRTYLRDDPVAQSTREERASGLEAIRQEARVFAHVQRLSFSGELKLRAGMVAGRYGLGGISQR